MADDIAIKASHVSKNFKLPHEKTSSIKSAVVNFYRRNKNYEIQRALQDISFEVKKGEFFGILGRNGSGKSTMLKMLAGIYSPSQGSIEVSGKLTPFIELGVGFNPELTGRENVYLNGALLGFTRREMDAMYDEIVDFAELKRFMDQKLKNYSSGMQVRLAFSIAIQAKSDILLIDEVLAVGDQLFQEKCFETFKEIKRQKKTVIFVSHDLASVEAFCDRAVLIENSKLVTIGRTQDVIATYTKLLAEEETKIKATRGGDKLIHMAGTGEVVITGANLFGLDGKKLSHVDEGKGFAVRVYFDAKQDVVKPVVGIGILDKDNVSILGPNTKETRYSIPVITTGKGWVEAKFATNVLASETYTIRAAIFNESGMDPYDFAENIMKFKVAGNRRHGKIFIEPEWSVGTA